MMSRAIEIMDIAAAHDGQYLLPQRYRREPIGTVLHGDATEKDYEACKALVENEWAHWLTPPLAPGIAIVGKW